MDEAVQSPGAPRRALARPVWPGLAAATGLAAGASLALVVWGPLFLRSARLVPELSLHAGAWMHGLLFAGGVALGSCLLLAIWSERWRREPVGPGAFVLLLVVSLIATLGGMQLVDGKLHRLLIEMPLNDADDYYVAAYEQDLGAYRRAVGGARIGTIFAPIALRQPNALKTADARLARAFKAASQYRVLDRIRRARARHQVEKAVLLGPARQEALAAFDRKYEELAPLAEQRWDFEDGVLAELKDISSLLRRTRWRVQGDRVLIEDGAKFDELLAHAHTVSDLEDNESRVVCRLFERLHRTTCARYY